MNKNTNIMTVNVNGKIYKAYKTTNRPGVAARRIERFTQVLATYKVANHAVELEKNFVFGEHVGYRLVVVTEWSINGKLASTKTIHVLKESENINDLVDYMRAMIDKEKEFGKKLLNLD